MESAPASSRKSWVGSIPSIFRPISTKTASGVMETTVPWVACPRAGPWCFCSNSVRISANEFSPEAAAGSGDAATGAAGGAGDVRFSMKDACTYILTQRRGYQATVPEEELIFLL